MTQTTAVFGTAQEIISYLQTRGDGARYLLTPTDVDRLDQEEPLSPEEEDALIEDLARIGRGRLDPNLRYDREDIYFDR